MKHFVDFFDSFADFVHPSLTHCFQLIPGIFLIGFDPLQSVLALRVLNLLFVTSALKLMSEFLGFVSLAVDLSSSEVDYFSCDTHVFLFVDDLVGRLSYSSFLQA